MRAASYVTVSMSTPWVLFAVSYMTVSVCTPRVMCAICYVITLWVCLPYALCVLWLKSVLWVKSCVLWGKSHACMSTLWVMCAVSEVTHMYVYPLIMFTVCYISSEYAYSGVVATSYLTSHVLPLVTPTWPYLYVAPRVPLVTPTWPYLYVAPRVMWGLR